VLARVSQSSYPWVTRAGCDFCGLMVPLGSQQRPLFRQDMDGFTPADRYLPAMTIPSPAKSRLAVSSYNLTMFNQLNADDARSQRAWRSNVVDIFEGRSWHNALKEKSSRSTWLAIS